MGIEELYEEGRFGKALEKGNEAFGSLLQWDDQTLAGRVAAQVGAPRMGRYLHIRAGRREPESPRAQCFFGYALLASAGPWVAYLLTQKRSALFQEDCEPETRVRWLLLRAEILTFFHDFRGARQALAEAGVTGLLEPWRIETEIELLKAEDRRSEALQLVEETLPRYPRHHPLFQIRAQLLEDSGRLEEAEQVLRAAREFAESCWLTVSLARLLSVSKRHREALRLFREFDAARRLPDKDVDRRVAQSLFRCHYELGETEEAQACLGDHAVGAHKTLLANLRESGGGARSKVLGVEFVRQHRMTCGPATLTALARYWGKEADHLQIAEEICYDGTSHSAQRQWAESQGWEAREFSLDWESARALIDRDIPFTLATVEIEFAHLQAVVGYDENLGVLKCRDPSFSSLTELLAEKGLERYRFSGPRAMALVPSEQSARLDLELPDQKLYDLSYRLTRELENQNRPRAEQILARMAELSPRHRLTHYAEFSLAVYDEDLRRQLECTEKLREQFPESEVLAHQACLLHRKLGEQARASEILEVWAEKPAASAVLIGHLAASLMEDASQFPRVERLLQKALARFPVSPLLFNVFGLLRWKERKWEEALVMARFASCLEDAGEGPALRVFHLSEQVGEQGDGLNFLLQRYERLGRLRPASGMTLVTALEELRRASEAHTYLEELLSRFPTDSELLLFAADSFARYGDFERAERLLDQVTLDASELNLLRARAGLSNSRGHWAETAEYWRMVIRREPTAVDAHMELVNVLRQMGEHQSAREHVRKAVEAHPHNVTLHQLYYSTLAEEDEPEALAAIEKLLELTPRDAWSWRRCALMRDRAGDREGADVALDRARSLGPDSPELFEYEALIQQRRGNLKEAQSACRRAIALDLRAADRSLEILVECTAGRDELRGELDFFWDQLVKHKGDVGAALMHYQRLAAGLMEAGALTARMESFVARRDAYPEELAVVIRQARRSGDMDKAVRLANDATARFPKNLVLWLTLADLHRLKGEFEEERRCLERALKVEPRSAGCLRNLAFNYARAGDLDAAARYLEQAVAMAPQSAESLASLADALWSRGKKEEALETMQRALRVNPSLEWGWEELARWCEGGPRDLPLQLAREILKARPRAHTSWLRLFQQLPVDAHRERLEALDRAAELAPLSLEVHDARVSFFIDLGQYEEAERACHPPAWQTPPVALAGRRCWIWAGMGDTERALLGMKELLEREPEYEFGWSSSANWLRKLDRKKEFLQLARASVEAIPESSQCRVLLAIALGDNEEDPREEFSRALELEARDSILSLLLDEHIERRDAGSLERDLSRWGFLLEGLQREYYGFQSQVLRTRLRPMKEIFARICRDPELDQILGPAFAAFREMMKADTALQILREAGQVGEGTVAAGSLFSEAMGEMDGPDAAEKSFADIPGGSDFRHGALSGLMMILPPAGVVRWMVTDSEELKAHDKAWATVAGRLMEMLDYKKVVEWTGDWKSRSNLQQHVVVNRAVALRHLGRDAEAREIERWADANLTAESHVKILLGLGYLESGELEKARLNLQAARVDSVSPYYGVIYRLIQVWLAAAQRPDSELKKYAGKGYDFSSAGGDRLLRRIHNQVLRAAWTNHHSLVALRWVLVQYLRREKQAAYALFLILGAILVALILNFVQP